MILIISTEEDVHAPLVLQHLHAASVPATRVDFAALGEDAWAAWAAPGGPSVFEDDAGNRIDLAEVRCVWLRRLRFPVVRQHPFVVHRRFITEEWVEFLAGMLLQLDAALINHPQRQLMCPKPLQLQRASALGIEIPRTLITNRADKVREFVATHPGGVIHKAFRPVEGQTLMTKAFTPADSESLSSLYLAPAIFQERLRKVLDVRVVWMRGLVFAVGFEADPGVLDGRVNPDAPSKVISLPESLEARIAALMEALGLELGVLDFVVDDEGRFVFLEVNPQGNYLYLEYLTDLPITAAVADLLASASRERESSSSTRISVPAPGATRGAR